MIPLPKLENIHEVETSDEPDLDYGTLYSRSKTDKKADNNQIKYKIHFLVLLFKGTSYLHMNIY